MRQKDSLSHALGSFCTKMRALCLLLATVLRGVVFAGFLGMMGGVQMVPMRDVRMIPRHFVFPGLVLFRGLPMMAGGMLVMLSGFVVVFCSGMASHGCLSFLL